MWGDHPPASCEQAWCSSDPLPDHSRPPLEPPLTLDCLQLQHSHGQSSPTSGCHLNRKKKKIALMFSWQRCAKATPPVAAVRAFKAATCRWNWSQSQTRKQRRLLVCVLMEDNKTDWVRVVKVRWNGTAFFFFFFFFLLFPPFYERDEIPGSCR